MSTALGFPTLLARGSSMTSLLPLGLTLVRRAM